MSAFDQDHIVSIIVVMWYSLKTGSVIPSALFFLKIPLAIQRLNFFHIIFKIFVLVLSKLPLVFS